MAFNIMIHVCIGFLGAAQFRFSVTGVLLSIAVACATQGVELLNIYMRQKSRLEGRAPEKEYHDKKPSKKKKGKGKKEQEPQSAKEIKLEEQIAKLKVEFKERAPALFLKNVGILSALTVVTAEVSREILSKM